MPLAIVLLLWSCLLTPFVVAVLSERGGPYWAQTHRERTKLAPKCYVVSFMIVGSVLALYGVAAVMQ